MFCFVLIKVFRLVYFKSLITQGRAGISFDIPEFYGGKEKLPALENSPFEGDSCSRMYKMCRL